MSITVKAVRPPFWSRAKHKCLFWPASTFKQKAFLSNSRLCCELSQRPGTVAGSLIGEKNLHTDAPLKCALILIYLENPYSQFKCVHCGLLNQTGSHLRGPRMGWPPVVSLGDVRCWPDGTWAHTSDINQYWSVFWSPQWHHDSAAVIPGTGFMAVWSWEAQSGP